MWIFVWTVGGECCKGTIGRLGGGIMVALRFVRMLEIVDPP